jgi:S-adenosylmethionine:tRNA ribosyltransferase-isomerase
MPERTNISSLKYFDYGLPEELIAQAPLPDRDGARMLVIDRATQTWQDLRFKDFPGFIRPGDCVVLNDSRVIPSRLFGRSESGATVQLFLLKPEGELRWTALGRPGRRLLARRKIFFEKGLTADVLETRDRGERLVHFQGVSNNTELIDLLEQLGHIPLPPYIHREDNTLDRERYQTVFARERGSVAAPTAGLHFTPRMLEQVQARGANIERVTLHVGLGTFQPIDVDDFESHTLHHEHYEVPDTTYRKIEAAGRVIAVGTTSVRTIESIARTGQLSGDTNLFLYPGAQFQRTGALLTNFHLPQSSLLLLVCAFAGTDLMLNAYRHAVRERYRFFSYGDCMLII